MYVAITFIVFVILFVGTCIILPEYPLSEALFDAVNHAMAGQSTGGFSTLDDSIATYNSAQMDYLYLFPMLIGGIFITISLSGHVSQKNLEIWLDIQSRSLIIAAIVGGFILSLLLWYSDVTP